MKIKRSKKWWLAKAKLEGGLPIGAGSMRVAPIDPTDLATRELLRMGAHLIRRAIYLHHCGWLIQRDEVVRAAKSCRLRAARLKKGKVK